MLRKNVKLKKKQNLGLTALQKLLLQLAASALYLFVLYRTGHMTASLWVPFTKIFWQIPIWVYIPFAIIVIVGCVNAVNLTDGIDGLATGVTMPVMIFFSVLLRRASPRFWVKLSGIGFFLHALVMWLAPNFPVLYAAQVFEATGYALYTVAVVYFVNDLMESGDRVKGQAWFAMTNTIGILLGTSIGGVLLDQVGAGGLLCFATVTAGGGMVLLFALLRGKETPSPDRI